MVSTKRKFALSSLAILGALGLLSYVRVLDVQLVSEDGDEHANDEIRRTSHVAALSANYLKHRSDLQDYGQESNTTTDAAAVTGGKGQMKEKKRRSKAEVLRAEKVSRLSALSSQIRQSKQQSPACHPHFQSLASNTTWTWSNDVNFQRIYFYHTRKAGGTSLAQYFSKVALHHGIEFDQNEWVEAEGPGTHDVPTFYVTHLREPIARSISHFKYQGRWDCRDLLRLRRKDDTRFVPTEDNANKIESWNATGGHSPTTCKGKASTHFSLGECAVNCYTQWFSGLSCPEYDISTKDQYHVAKAKLYQYNFIVVLEKLSDPDYASAVEKFFGVPGITEKRAAFCERTSHKANKMNPLVMRNDTIEKLVKLNEVDIGLYKELTDCLDGNSYDFPKLDPSRFVNTTTKVPYYEYDDWKKAKKLKKKLLAEEDYDEVEESTESDDLEET